AVGAGPAAGASAAAGPAAGAPADAADAEMPRPLPHASSFPPGQDRPAPLQHMPAALAHTEAAELQESIKGLLLQLSTADELPLSFRDAAQQVLQHLTGQQLLLNTDRTAPFAQITMFIPLHGPDGEQTASVQIQSKRGRKGELDHTNCRLWFDLDMKTLGHTVIDVQVVDRIVSIQMKNDQPWAQELFASQRQTLAGAVEGIGYQLLSIKTTPFPEPEAEPISYDGNSALDYIPDAYKGVDLKI
ncbi:hypothetical protein HII30_10185, partial [Paenibacillus lemnae]|nr:hypothetical protein [Paenibacillus lemnae]